MASLNRFLIILIAIMAVFAAYLSFRLFERRNDFRNRAADLAETVKVVVDNLDDRSNTRVQKEISFAPADKEENQPESGTLSWKEYDDPEAFNERLDQVETLAANLNEQRNYLAEQIRNIALELGIPAEELSVDDLTNAADDEIYKDSAQKIVRLATAVAERSNAMIQTVITTAKMEHVNVSLSEADFRERETTTDEDGNDISGSFTYQQPLEAYQTAVSDLNTRYADYKNTLASAVTQVTAFDWNTTASRISNPGSNYSPALTTLTNDFSRLNEQLVKGSATITKTDSLQNEIDELQNELDKVLQERNELRATVQRQKNIIEANRLEAPDSTTTDGAKLDPDLEGQVLMVNEQWNFLILSLGQDQIHTNAELLIAREGKYIARVVVTNITETISVAEVLPQTQQAQIQKGDTVLAPGPGQPQG